MRKVLMLLLSISIICINIPALATNMNFSDVNTSDWYYQTVMNMVDFGLVDGYNDGTFKPNQSISRIEFTKIAYEALPISKPLFEVSEEDKEEYLDSAGNFWGREIVLEAAERGLGWFGTETDEWNKPITRAEMASVAFDACVSSSKNAELSYYIDVLTAFGDYGDCLASDYCTSIVYMCSTGIFVGINDNMDFAPDSTATRAEACTIINRLLDKSLRYDPTTYTEKYTDAPFFTSYITKCLGNDAKNYDDEPIDYSYFPSTSKGTSYTDVVYVRTSSRRVQRGC